jgi:hypothetical protein
LLWIAITVDIYLGKSIKYGGVLGASLDTRFKPRENQFEPVPLFNFVDKFVDREVASNGSQQSFNGRLVAVNV